MDNIKYLNAICEYRGKFIDACIMLEITMDTFISDYFSEGNKKRSELMALVLAPRVSWREKLAVFTVIIEVNHKDFYDKNSTLNTDITDIIEHRNVFAHLPSNLTPNGQKLYNTKGIISFLKLKNARQKKDIVLIREPSYTAYEFNELIKAIKHYHNSILT